MHRLDLRAAGTCGRRRHHNVRLRWPVVGFKVTHVHVQGEQCPSDVVAAIRQLDADPDVDVIIVARGGGAFEDLIGFPMRTWCAPRRRPTLP